MAYDISMTENITLISLNDSTSEISIIAQIFDFLASNGIDVDMISQIPPHASTPCLSFTVKDDDLSKVFAAASKLREIRPEIKLAISSGNSKISIYSADMKDCPGVAAKAFKAISENNIDVRMITTSEADISVLVYAHDGAIVYDSLCKAFN